MYFDVHVPSAIADGLRLRGVDVLRAQEDGTPELNDPLDGAGVQWTIDVRVDVAVGGHLVAQLAVQEGRFDEEQHQPALAGEVHEAADLGCERGEVRVGLVLREHREGAVHALEALLDPTHEEHRSMLRWAGGHFDPEWFDLQLVNKYVARALHANLKRRAHQPKPNEPLPVR